MRLIKIILIFLIALIFAVVSLFDIRTFVNNSDFRIDLKGNLATQNISVVSDNPEIKIIHPNWCANCITISANTNKMPSKANIKISLTHDDKIAFRLMGPDVSQNGQRIPVLVSYNKLVIDGKQIFSKPITVFHDKPFVYKQEIKSGKEIELSVNIKKPGLISFLRHYPIDTRLFLITVSFWVLVLFTIARFIRNGKIGKADAALMFVFATILFVPMSHISDAQKNDKENRLYPSAPSLIVDNKINEKYGTQFDAWFNDRFNGREILINAFSEIKYKLSNVYQTQTALLIKNNGWMFNKRDFDYLKNANEQIENLKKFDDFCRQHNIKLYVMFVPEKETIYSKILNEHFAAMKNFDENTRRYVDIAKTALDNNRVFYPDKELIDASQQDFTFFKQSHHWTDFGAYIGYKTLGQRIKQDFPRFNIVSLDEYDKSFSNLIRDDYGRNYHNGDTTRTLNLADRADILLNTKYTYYDFKRTGTIKETRLKYIKLFTNHDTKAKYKIFLVGNSQNENLLQFLAPSVKSLKFLRLNKNQLTQTEQWKFMKHYKQELLEYNPDIVVICISASAFPSLFDDFYKD